jgi:CTP synthase
MYVDKIQKAGMTISGRNKELSLVEVVELSEHPFFIGCQYHPEFKSRPFEPHPLFDNFVKAAIQHQKGNK